MPKLNIFYEKLSLNNKSFIYCILLIFSFQLNFIQAQIKSKFILTLDAGHGAHDSGATGFGFKEKDVTLGIVLKLGRKIEENQKDVKVIYTRTDDSYPELYRRTEIANSNKSNLFISVHCNSSKVSGPLSRGTETWILGAQNEKKKHDNFDAVAKENSVIFLEKDYDQNYDGYNPNSPESVIGMTLMQDKFLENSLRFAQIMEQTFQSKEERNSRGVKQGPFLVLVRTAMPAVLIETGFINHKDEAYYLASEEGQEKIAESIYETFVKYKKEYYNKSGIEIEIPKEEKPIIVEPEEIITQTISNNSDIFYKIMFLNSSVRYEKNAVQFRNVQDVEMIKVGDKYQYYTGNSNNRKDLMNTILDLRKAGFNSSQIIEFNTKKELIKENYTIELMLVNERYRKNDPELKNLQKVERIKIGSMFEYLYGNFKTLDEAQKNLDEIKKLGFNDAILVIQK